MFGNHGLGGLPEEGAHEKSPKCLGGNLGDFLGGFWGILQRSLVLKFCYPQLDFAERQCRHTFGECFGECLQRQSEYPSCFEPLPHCHNGRWRARWLAKTGYDFGYCEWLFAEGEACRRLAACVPGIGFGEHYG